MEMKKNRLMGNINVVFEKSTEHANIEDAKRENTYLVDGVLIESVEIKVTTVTGEVLTLKGVDWDAAIEDLVDAEYGESLVGEK